MAFPPTETQLFEFYANHIWPLHRKFLSRYLSSRCQNCIISEKCSPLVNGLCEYCRLEISQNVTNHLSSADSDVLSLELELLLNSYQGQGFGNYDALVLFSGGKDSTFLVHQLQTKHPHLRLLACCVDSGFLSPIAISNLDYVWRRSNVDHLILRPNQELFRRVFRLALTNLDNRPCYEVIDRLDGDLVHDIARNLAASMQIPLLISGVSTEQVRRIFSINSFEMPQDRELTPRTHSAAFDLKTIFTSNEMQYWWNPNRYPKKSIPRVIFPMVAWGYEEQKVREIVRKNNLLPSKCDTPLVTNNRLIPLMGVIDIARKGYSSFEPEFAQMIRDGKSSRKLWRAMFELLEYSGKTGFLLKKQVDTTLSELGLSRQQLGILF